MATVAQTPTPRKAPIATKAFYAHFHDEAGYLTKWDGELLFLADGSTTPHVIEPEDVCSLTVLGEVGTATMQFVVDQIRGGYAAIACHRN